MHQSLYKRAVGAIESLVGLAPSTFMFTTNYFLMVKLTLGKKRDFLGSSNLSFDPQTWLTPNFGIRKI